MVQPGAFLPCAVLRQRGCSPSNWLVKCKGQEEEAVVFLLHARGYPDILVFLAERDD